MAVRVRVAALSGAAGGSDSAARIPRGACAVVIDVLRATTTLTVALAHGASRVVPVATPEEALAARTRHPGSLVCGERDGRIVPGFDLGNSPDEYDSGRVRGRTLIFASTNGSLAMLAARGARRRVLAAFVNLAAVADAVAREAEVAILCAGKLGRFALEDAACAGLLIARLESRGAILEGEAARCARALAPAVPHDVRAIVEGCSHGRYLRRLGGAFGRDVEFCGGLDTMTQAFEL